MTEHMEDSSLPTLYSILGLQSDVCTKPDCNELIHKAYVMKAKKYHPDKCDCDENMKQVFELITHAYDVLRDDTKRSDYNNKLKVQNQSSNDFDSLKANFNKYIDSKYPSTVLQEEEAENAKQIFETKYTNLDEKHNYNRSDTDTITDYEKKLQELISERELADKSYHIPQICDPNNMNLDKFNAMFDNMAKVSNTSLTTHTRPDPWVGSNKNFNFSDFDTLDNIYSQFNDKYDCPTSSAGLVSTESNIPNYSDVNLNDYEPVTYVNAHDDIENNYYQSITSKIEERIKQTKEIESMTYSDYKLNNTEGYGIYDELLGYEHDDDMAALTNPTILKMLMQNKPR